MFWWQGDAQSTNLPRHCSAAPVRKHLGHGGHGGQGPAGEGARANRHVCSPATAPCRADRMPQNPLLGGPPSARVSSSLRSDRLHRLWTLCGELPGGVSPRGQGARAGAEGFPGQQFHDRLRRMPAVWAVRCIVPGGVYRDGRFPRPDGEQPRTMHRRLFSPAGRGGLGPLDALPGSDRSLCSHGPDRAQEAGPARRGKW